MYEPAHNLDYMLVKLESGGNSQFCFIAGFGSPITVGP